MHPEIQKLFDAIQARFPNAKFTTVQRWAGTIPDVDGLIGNMASGDEFFVEFWVRNGNMIDTIDGTVMGTTAEEAMEMMDREGYFDVL